MMYKFICSNQNKLYTAETNDPQNVNKDIFLPHLRYSLKVRFGWDLCHLYSRTQTDKETFILNAVQEKEIT